MGVLNVLGLDWVDSSLAFVLGTACSTFDRKIMAESGHIRLLTLGSIMNTSALALDASQSGEHESCETGILQVAAGSRPFSSNTVTHLLQ